MRAKSTPYHRAIGLLDYAEHLPSIGRAEETAALVDEASKIAERLRCGPLVLRSSRLAQRSGSLS
jgi:hypothetical protein